MQNNSNYGRCDPMGRMSNYTLHSMNEGSLSNDSEPNLVGGASGFGAGLMGKRSAEDAGLDHEPESIGISSDEESGEKMMEEPPKKTPPPNGKKTKGRVKIKMEFIDNKLRRYTTFSKRKTGIMKKAYELSTLTGTQVMLLVASETGHVYTFATRKLQPMITSEAGKALIQTCLNSPDPPMGHSQQPDQRMSATGFEETDLTYSIGDEDQKDLKLQTIYSGGSQMESSNSPPSTSQVVSTSTSLPVTHVTNSSSGSNTKSNISMQLPTTGYTTILASGAPLHLGTLQTQGNTQTHQQQNNQQAPTLYRIPQQPVVSIPGVTPTVSTQSNSVESTQNTVTMVPSTQQLVSGNMMLPGHTVVTATPTSSISGTVMYQTAQGVVYAAPTSGTLPEGVIFNFGQASAALQIPQDQGGTSAPQQYITIPVPVSLTTAPQLMTAQAGLSPTSSSSSEPSSSPGVTDLSKTSKK